MRFIGDENGDFQNILTFSKKKKCIKPVDDFIYVYIRYIIACKKEKKKENYITCLQIAKHKEIKHLCT